MDNFKKRILHHTTWQVYNLSIVHMQSIFCMNVKCSTILSIGNYFRGLYVVKVV